MGPRKKCGIPWECYNDDGQVVTDVDEILHKWKQEFCNLYAPGTNLTEERTRFKNDIYNENRVYESSSIDEDTLQINLPFLEPEIANFICKAKDGKSPGVDGVVYEVLKNQVSVTLLTKMFNLCFENLKVPGMWLQALINPIPKSSSCDPRIPLNYRGISLLSTIGKIYTSVLNTRLSSFVEEENLVVNEQNGFRQNRSCIDHIFVLHNILRIRNLLKVQTFCAFVEFQKAFDYVDREFLLYKLRQIGVTGNFYFAVKALYRDTKSCVKINNMYTEWFQVNNGVRQGDSMSPTLFSLFINDLATDVKDLELGVKVGGQDISILLYADDIVLISPTAENLQQMLNEVSNWCLKWGMRINPSKTRVMYVRNHQRPRTSHAFTCGEHKLSITDTYKYLGYILHEHLSNTRHVKVMTGSASRSFGRVYNMFKTIKNIGYKTYETLYNSYVDPNLNYSAGVWGSIILMNLRFYRTEYYVFSWVLINLHHYPQ